MGPLMVDVQGLALTDEDKSLLKNPSIAGVILFGRNYDNHSQLLSLIGEIRHYSHSPLVIAVDHEGGRVQRFRDGFTPIPPAQSYAELKSIEEAKSMAYDAGWMIAMELIAFDIDLSFAPVLDLGHQCLAIGSRSFHQDSRIALMVAEAMIDGMHSAGMKTTGKHFPGHGAVIADSHKETPVDERERVEIWQDMQIFSDLIALDKLDAIMPAHVLYPALDKLPASGSPFWLKTILREQLKFKGIIFSDDLSMEGAAFLGNYAERSQAALNAGCDILLACNNRQGTLEILSNLVYEKNDKAIHLFHKYRDPMGDNSLQNRQIDYNELIKSDAWKTRNKRLNQLNEEWQNRISR